MRVILMDLQSVYYEVVAYPLRRVSAANTMYMWVIKIKTEIFPSMHETWYLKIKTYVYIFVKQCFRDSIRDVKTLPGVDIDSCHILLVADMQTRLRAIKKSGNRKPNGM